MRIISWIDFSISQKGRRPATLFELVSWLTAAHGTL